LARGSRYNGKAQIFLLDLSNGSRRRLGKPANFAQLVFDGDRLGAVVAQRRAVSLRVWSLRTRRLVSAVRLPRSTKLKYFALVDGRIVLQAFHGFQGILSVDIHTGKAKVIERSQANNVYGPWVWRGRVVWVEQTYGRHPGSVVRSAPLR
jgi:tricorn protease-like protein